MPQSPFSSPARCSLRTDLALAIMPTATVLLVFALVEAWSHQKLLFASLASSAFIIYMRPAHESGSVRTVVLSQGMAALVGFGAHALGHGDPWVAGAAMVAVIFAMIGLRMMHPPAVSTALSFALSAGTAHAVLLFGVCLALVVVLVLAQQALARRIGRTALRERTTP